ncbi:LicD family protein [Natronosporangium hydrolyticum]|uniref:LicD family protein n=1 Tax=Natronosporangium hydrolyticum TaxID=2811111 RepID=A0A895YMD3_9ACTN|nr:LicD family protein [Natronosporangium hydrolyticum]QSB15260.1 LicD family protein [Natronosporangium hydrolyticum]
MRAGLVARVRATQSPSVWSAAAAACRVARRFSRNQSRWSSRLGYALERRDLARESRLDAAAGRGGGWRLRPLTAAEQAQLVARQRAHAGDIAGAVEAWQTVVELAGAKHPRWAVRLADLLDQVGEWREAQRVLTENAARHPSHALTHRRLGEVSRDLGRWGGTFTGTRAGRAEGQFHFEQPPTADITVARQALERAAELEPAKTTWREALSEARLADGDLAGAAALYDAALRDAAQSTGRWVLAVKHRWQFQLESIHHRQGQPRVEDPLFDCAVTPGGPVADGPVVGLFTARFAFSGLVISGLAATPGLDHVDLLLDGVKVRSLNVGGDGFFPQFGLDMKRPTVATFPTEATLTVQAPDGTRLRTTGGADSLRLTVPHGTGELPAIVAAGGKLDKKGVLSPSLAETRERQQRYLQIYAKVRDHFEQELGRPLFLMYGTLLGYHREGDFIPGDDDFDCGYVCDETDPIAVKEDTKRLVVQLVKAGFTVSFNRKGRLFRIQLEREATDGYHLDVRPLWFQNGRVWLHNHCSFPATREDFLPVAEGQLRGERVLVPKETEKFLRGHYGPGWHTPDPGFMYYTSEIDPAILENLGQALITVSEYKELAERVRRETAGHPEAGRLVSVGSQDLYPLAEFLP